MKNSLFDDVFSLGNIDAWDRNEQRNLQLNFLPTEAFSKIAKSGYTFLSGRRGTGKSAIALMLAHRFPSKYKNVIQGEESEYGTYMHMVKVLYNLQDTIEIKNSVRHLWLWALPLQAMQLIIAETKKANLPFNEDLQVIQEYLASLPKPLHEESNIGHILSNIFDNAYKKLRQKSIVEFKAYLMNLRNSKEFGSALKALQRITKTKQVIIILDTLESYKIFGSQMIEGLQGILEAIITLLADERMQGISFKFFLPAEIDERVFAPFPGKVSARAVRLLWRSADLIAMLARRYLNVLSRTKAIPEKNINELTEIVDEAYNILAEEDYLEGERHWGKTARKLRDGFWYKTNFLPEKIINSQGNEEDCFAYIFRHNQRRPRDLIAQMQAIIDESRKHNEFPHLSEKSIKSGIHNDKVLLQILGDALIPYEGRLKLGTIKTVRTILFQRPRIMKWRDFKQFASELYNIEPLADINPENFANILLSCGVMGVVKKDNLTEGEKELYCETEFNYAMHDNVVSAERFTYAVHPVIGDLLRMVQSEERGVVYPMPREDLWLEKQADIK